MLPQTDAWRPSPSVVNIPAELRSTLARLVSLLRSKNAERREQLCRVKKPPGRLKYCNRRKKSLEPLRTQHNPALHIIAEVDRLRRHHDLDRSRWPDHDVALSARITAATVFESAPRPTRIAMPSISSSITPVSRAGSRFLGCGGCFAAGFGGAAVTTAGTNMDSDIAGRGPTKLAGLPQDDDDGAEGLP